MLFRAALRIVTPLLFVTLLTLQISFAQSITIQGRVLTSAGTPVNGSTTQFRVQILAPDASRCVLYDETQTIDLSTSNGLFTINLNNGSGVVNAPNTYSLEQSLSNRLGFAINSTYCASGSGTVTYSPASTDNRKVLIQFRDPGSMTAFESIPELDMNPVPYAVESRALNGFAASNLLRVIDAGVPGTAPSLTSAQATEMQSLIAGTSTNYMSSSGSSSAGARLPTYSGNPGAPSVGSMWYDTTAGALKYFDGSTVQTVGTGSGAGTITGVTAGTGLSGGGTTGTVTVSLGTSGVTAATYGSATAIPVLTVDAYGRVTSASTTAVTGVLPAGTSGQFLKSDGTSWSSQKITMGDLKSTIGTADLFSSPGCTAAQSLYWDSGTDQLKCQNIAVDASAITAGTIADARLADVGTAGTYKIVTTDAKGRVTSGSNPTTLAGFGITDAVLHAGGITSVSSGVLASRPLPGTAGRLYVSTDNLTLYRDNGTSWDIIGAAGGGTSITEVSPGTGLTGGGTSGNVTLALTNVGTAGTYPKVTTDAQGRVTAGAALADTDIPNLNWSKITSGKPTDLSGYGITDAVRNAGSVVSFQAGTSRPAFGTAGRFYFNTSSNVLSYDTGAAWIEITSGGGFAGNLAGDVTGPQGTTVVASVGGSTAANVNAATVLANAATDANTASAIVRRDASGNFAAGSASLSSLALRNGANTATISPSTVTSSYTLRLPAGQATGNQLLQSDSSGNLSWVNPTAATSVAVTAPIVNSGTATAPNIGISQATTSTSGYLSDTDWDTFNDKLGKTLTAARIWVGNALNVATEVAPSGDVSMSNAGAFTVTGIRGTNVATTAPGGASGTGKVLRYDGTNYAPSFVGMGDLRSSTTGTNALGTSCTASQTLTWNSGTDSLQCQSIAIAGSAIASGTIDAARLPAAATLWTENGSDIYRATGNVGIGSSSPGAKLDVAGDLKLTGANPAFRISETDQATGDQALYFGLNNRSLILQARSDDYSSGGGSYLSVERSGTAITSFNFWRAGGAFFHVDNTTGGVAIGTTTPTRRLTVTSATSGTLANFKNAGGNSAIHVDAAGSGSSAEYVLQKAGVTRWSMVSDNATESGSNAGSNFQISRFADDGTFLGQAFTIARGSSNVGIGASSPTTTLDLVGGTLFDPSASNPGAARGMIHIAPLATLGTATDGSFGGAISFAGVANGRRRSAIANVQTGTDVSYGGLAFFVNSGGTVTAENLAERLRIISNGNVGIGSTSPKGGLDVATTGANSTLVLPRDTTAVRPTGAAAVNGMIRYSTDNNVIEAYVNGAWTTLATIGASQSFAGNVGVGGTLTATGAATFNGGATIAGGSLQMSNQNITGVGSNITGQGALTVASGGTNTNLGLQSNGTGSVNIGSTNGTSLAVLNGGASTVNYITVRGAAAGASPAIGTAGADTNIDLTFTPKGTGRTIFATGNVGIGTTTPNAMLDITSVASASLLMGRGSAGNFSFDNTGARLTFSRNSANYIDTSNASGTLNFTRQGSTLTTMVLDASGNVGIGASTPLAKLQVSYSNDDATPTDTTAPHLPDDGHGMALVNTSDTATYSGLFLKTRTTNGSTWSINNVWKANSAGDLTFVSRLGAVAAAERVRITAEGNVGIGTYTPGGVIHSLSDQAVFFDRTGTTNAGSNLLLRGAGGTVSTPVQSVAGDYFGSITFAGYLGSGWSTTGARIGGVATETHATSNRGTALTFMTTLNGNASNAERMRIDHNGNVGIGTTAPGLPFVVQGTSSYGIAEIVGNGTNAEAAIGIRPSNVARGNNAGQWILGSNLAGATGAPTHTFTIHAGAVGPIFNLTTGGNAGIGITTPQAKLHVAGNLRVDTLNAATATHLCIDANNVLAACSSSIRYKENVRGLGDSLATILNLRPVSYDWIQSKQHEVGFIAEEVEKIDSRLVTYNKEGRIQGVKYEQIVAPLVKAIQEIYQKILGTDARIAALESENTRLKAAEEAKSRELAAVKAKAEKAESKNAAIIEWICAKDPQAALCRP